MASTSNSAGPSTSVEPLRVHQEQMAADEAQMLNDIESKRLRLNELTMKRVKAEKALLALNPRFPSWWQAKKRNRFKEELKAIDKDQKDALVAWEIAVKARQDLQDYRKGQRRSAQR